MSEHFSDLKPPTLASLFGSVPNLTGEMGSVEFVRRQRDEAEPDAVIDMELGDWTKRVRDAVFFTRAACKRYGYALAVHGTLRRDIDVVAVPWTGEAVAPDVLARGLFARLTEQGIAVGWGEQHEFGSARPHGRHSWSIVLSRAPFMYLDLSVMPPVLPPPASDASEADDALAIAVIGSEISDAIAAHDAGAAVDSFARARHVVAALRAGGQR